MSNFNSNLKQQDADSYDPVVSQFDHFTTRLSEPLAAHLLNLAGISVSDRVLDVGTGTGVVALQIPQFPGFRGRVAAIDLSEGMLAHAKHKAHQQGSDKIIDFYKMDAEKLDFEGSSFDKVVSLYAVHHFPSPKAALSEMLRVLAPGGKLVIGVGSGPQLLSLSGIAAGFRHLKREWLKLRGKQLVAPEFLNRLAEKHLPRMSAESTHTVHHSLNNSNLCKLIKEVGFQLIATDWQGHQATLLTAEEFWELQRTFSSTVRERISQANKQNAESLKADFLQVCHQVQTSGGSLVYPYAAFFIVAQHPSHL